MTILVVLVVLCLCVGTPPADCVLKAMAIHKAPENIGDNLICCPSHLDRNIQDGTAYPTEEMFCSFKERFRVYFTHEKLVGGYSREATICGSHG